MAEKAFSTLYEFFADCLDYPSSSLRERVRDGAPRLPDFRPAAGLVEEFAGFVKMTPLEDIEELYTATFDLQPSCYPYIGYQLFGEDYTRGIFMARLKDCYRTCGYSCAPELPDHISVMLRFLAQDKDAEQGEELVNECIIPALRKMAQPLEERENPYGKVLQALVLYMTM